ncbi:hypothetical protein HYALB_00013551 [Hymenoscyphus albidus]|uniref:2EXR domain-containing protein n=1 Tax=Hymenoscyphus albidus TaxID=595503 RepID=A0A9N9LTJ3_9HELO|nr:hypothetical protein HYALB_00013551 [Hymenoscyphus albidus]
MEHVPSLSEVIAYTGSFASRDPLYAENFGQKFPRFSSLPLEIRFVIWEYVRPAPRYIKLSCRECKSKSKWDRDPRGCCFAHPLYSRAPPPALLHVNSESRAVALKCYSLSFGWVVCGPPKVTYFDWERDGIFWDYDESHDVRGLMTIGQLNNMSKVRLKHIVFYGLDSKHVRSHFFTRASLLRLYTGLESSIEITVAPRGIVRGFIEQDDEDLKQESLRARAILFYGEVVRFLTEIRFHYALRHIPLGFWSWVWVATMAFIIWDVRKVGRDVQCVRSSASCWRLEVRSELDKMSFSERRALWIKCVM